MYLKNIKSKELRYFFWNPTVQSHLRGGMWQSLGYSDPRPPMPLTAVPYVTVGSSRATVPTWWCCRWRWHSVRSFTAVLFPRSPQAVFATVAHRATGRRRRWRWIGFVCLWSADGEWCLCAGDIDAQCYLMMRLFDGCCCCWTAAVHCALLFNDVQLTASFCLCNLREVVVKYNTVVVLNPLKDRVSTGYTLPSRSNLHF